MGNLLPSLLRELAPQVLGSLTRRYPRDFAGAEDATQEALLAASQQWPRDGVPDNPKGWLLQAAIRRMTDQQRSEIARRKREQQVPDFGFLSSSELVDEGDDTLQLFFLCCHPALSQASAIALTLRAVGGLTTAEVARAFLVPEATMAQRISRAKQTIAASGVPFARLQDEERRTRMSAVLQIVYLIFNEGYTASSGEDLQRADLASEAIRLARLLCALSPQDGHSKGLLALLLLTDARRLARTGSAGEIVPLDEQDRTLWNSQAIAEGKQLVERAMLESPTSGVGPYTIQAAIAALHDEAANTAETDWPQILALYEVLRRMTPGPVVELNYAVAEAMVHGPAAGLRRLDGLGPGLQGHHHRVPAVRGHLLEMAGDTAGAVEQYGLAARLTANVAEQRYLLTRAAKLSSSTSKQK